MLVFVFFMSLQIGVFFLFITSSKYTGNIFREIIVYLCVETDT